MYCFALSFFLTKSHICLGWILFNKPVQRNINEHKLFNLCFANNKILSKTPKMNC